MCYRVITHTLRCDARPLVSDGKSIFVDNYAIPQQCDCSHYQASIKPWFRCESHGCCMRTAKLYPCAGLPACCEVTDHHRYEQAPRPESKIWCKTCNDAGTSAANPQKGWIPTPDFDEAGHTWLKGKVRMAPQNNDLYKAALTNVLLTGRLIISNFTKSDKLTYALYQQHMAHNKAHGPCHRVLNAWECPQLKTIQRLQDALDGLDRVLAEQRKLYLKNWELLSMAKDVRTKTTGQILASMFTLDEFDKLFMTPTTDMYAPSDKTRAVGWPASQKTLRPDDDEGDDGEYFAKCIMVLESLHLLDS